VTAIDVSFVIPTGNERRNIQPLLVAIQSVAESIRWEALSVDGLDGRRRRFYSIALRELSRVVFARRLSGISDPLGGFFLVRRATVEGVQLRPIGY